MRALAQLGRLSKGRGGNKEDEVPAGVPCVRYGDLYTTHDYFVRASRSFVSKEKASEYTAIKFGDVLFAGSGETIDEIGKSAVNLMRADACCGGDVIVFRPERHSDARYMGYAAGCHPAAAQKATMGRGITVMHIYGTQLKFLSLPFPPLPEQAADRPLPRLRRPAHPALHPRQAEADYAVWRSRSRPSSIRPSRARSTSEPAGRYPAYKPSGVEWLGDVPESLGSQVQFRRIRQGGNWCRRAVRAANWTYWSVGDYHVSSTVSRVSYDCTNIGHVTNLLGIQMLRLYAIPNTIRL